MLQPVDKKRKQVYEITMQKGLLITMQKGLLSVSTTRVSRFRAFLVRPH